MQTLQSYALFIIPGLFRKVNPDPKKHQAKGDPEPWCRKRLRPFYLAEYLLSLFHAWILPSPAPSS